MNFENIFMKLALDEAKKAYLLNEVPVGAIIVNRNTKEIISTSYNQTEITCNPTYHAEIIAINNACKFYNNKNLSSCDLYVTLEPCAMCACAISHARIGRLFYAAYDKKGGAVENGVRFFTNSNCLHRPEIYPNIMAEESSKLLQNFFKTLR